jgi:hypothetical protein
VLGGEPKTIMSRRQKTPGSREWAIAALLVVAAALCWISWRAGSPLMSGIRDYDVVSEILRLNQKPRGAPVTKVP